MKPEDLTPNQMVSLLALAFMMFTMLVGAVAAWSYAISFFRSKRPFSTTRGPLATFGLIDIAVGIVFIFSMLLVVQTGWTMAFPKSNPVESASEDMGSTSESDIQTSDETNNKSESDDESSRVSTNKLTSSQVVVSGLFATGELLTVFVVAIFTLGRTGCRPMAIGWNTLHPFRDIGIGLVILLMTLPLLLIVSAIVSSLTGVEYNHPVIDMMKQYPWLLGVVAWQAVIVAPIAEEFFFRSVLIGWFESIHYGKSGQAAFSGWNPNTPRTDFAENEAEGLKSTDFRSPQQIEGTVGISSDVWANPYSSSDGNIGTESPMAKVTSLVGIRFDPPWWPAIVSGLLFGLAHIGYGLSWIPLALFGIVLGRVYQHRQSLIMCITIHMVFNAINLFNLWLSLGLPKPQ